MSTVLISKLEREMTNQIDNTHNANAGIVKTNDIVTMTDNELDFVAGGDPAGYHECVLGSVGGGGPGLYPLYVACRLK